MSDWYWLRDDKTVEPGPDVGDREAFRAYSNWLYKENGGKNKRVAQTEIGTDIWVSTVFLGLNHSYDPNGPPVLFETLVMGGPNDQDMFRYHTWDEAVAGHNEQVAKQILHDRHKLDEVAALITKIIP